MPKVLYGDDCPTCGDSFESAKGVKLHHARSHGETLPNRRCKHCSNEFYDEDGRREFCGGCLNISQSGKYNGNWNGGKDRGSCKACGDEFEYYSSDKPGHLCRSCITSGVGLNSDGEVPEESRDVKRQKINRIKSEVGCTTCGYNEYPVALSFHHVSGDKLNTVSELAARNVAWDTIKEEIKKCIILCRNCHAVEHWSPKQ